MTKAAPTFSRKEQLFNSTSLDQLAREYARVIPGLDAAQFTATALAGVADRSLLACLDWFADCIEPFLPATFPAMAETLEAAMPPILDPTKHDNDFGDFIHAVPGVLAVRHGLKEHPDRALDLLYQATQRFSMEFYIRPFLDHWPEKTWDRLMLWARDSNYHVRRLVSEGTRPRLPWSANISMAPGDAMPLLDLLQADPTRYVTRSVANHLNDITKTNPDLVLAALERWRKEGTQNDKEHAWMTRHSLRTLVKKGHVGSLRHIGYDPEADIDTTVALQTRDIAIGDALGFQVTLKCSERTPAIVDYRIRFAHPEGRTREKVYKLKSVTIYPDQAISLSKTHVFKADATTFSLYSGLCELTVLVNGKAETNAHFMLR